MTFLGDGTISLAREVVSATLGSTAIRERNVMIDPRIRWALEETERELAAARPQVDGKETLHRAVRVVMLKTIPWQREADGGELTRGIAFVDTGRACKS